MAKKLLLVVVFFSSVTQMFGECLGGYIDIWPRNNETHSESVFLLEGNGIGDIMLDINKKYKTVLKSKEHVVFLEIIQILMGAGDDVQVMLKPLETLKEGANYQLVLEGLDVKSNRFEKHFMERFNSELKRYEPVNWTIINKRNSNPPLWGKPPRLIEKFASNSGNGILSGLVYESNIIANEEVLIYVEVKDISTNRIQSHYVIPYKGEFVIGSRGCEGDFELDYGNSCFVRMIIVDSSGNQSSTKIVQLVEVPEIWP